ncbi:MAG: biopolymer transporter ExbD [Myxococcota bacterium]|nr:biopolymer transporter ExbD [Myxococcota bacterium]
MRMSPRKKKKPTLMLTSLLDMFTIILIFLIVSFEAEDHEFKLDPNLKLPESTARSKIKPAANVAITMGSVSVQGEQIVALAAGVPTPDDVDEEKGHIPKLVDVLERVLTARQASPTLEGDEMIVMLQADRGLTYRTLYMVMRSAGDAGFDKYRLTVMKK